MLSSYLDLVADRADRLAGQLFAHHHTDSWKVVVNDKAGSCLAVQVFLDAGGAPVSWALLAPGLSPMTSTLAPETGANNPGIRLVQYNKTSGQVLQTAIFYIR